ncbi:GHF27 protein (modular protein) [Verrucomicrobia bacterium]|nr:GHF27 protein (modular protein) [Verrucomicrobiota bacterium]
MLLAQFCGLASETVRLEELDLTKMRQDWGNAQVARSITEQPLSIAGQKFAHGVGTHANSLVWIDLARGSERFNAFVGIDDDVHGAGSVEFKVIGDGHLLWDSGIIKSGQKAKAVDVNLRGLHTLELVVGDAGDGISYDHADWAEAGFLVSGAKPQTIHLPPEPAVVLTPKPKPGPRLNGPSVYGCRPGHPFLYRIPCQGQRPIRFEAEGLPSTLQLDRATGIITGSSPERGEYRLTFKATNARGHVSRSFRIISGDTLALTPPMGWNDWYAHYDRITDAMVRAAADALVRYGLADVGYQYVNIDDCWMNAQKCADPARVGPPRDAEGRILPNQHFPDMKALTEYIHASGLKAGIYTSPGPQTCGGFTGSYQHEEQDAAQFADWGFDFLKYDWCSYDGVVKGDHSLESLQKPYRLMGEILARQPRDMVFNLCQYGMGKVWEWGAEVGGQSWRTAGDLGMELDRFFQVALKNAEHRTFSRPGSWNDPDYIQIGYIGNARANGMPQPCDLTPNDQYSYMSLWCLMAAPLFYSGDMSRLDDFTINVLCNPEMIDVDQDALGQSATLTRLSEGTFIMVKNLEDGSKAVGLFNQGELPEEVSATWSLIKVSGRQAVRDLWRQMDIGVFGSKFKASVPRHGVCLVRLKAYAK